jgi:glycine dehydrogenase subunit 1
MLDDLGLATVDDLFDQIPADVRLDRPLDLPDGVSEQELLTDVAQLAKRTRSADDLVCFAGAGAYDHYVPSAVWSLAGRSEFSTSYTPYQPELSQGVLQALFEFQSMVCELTAMEVSNASLYDGSTALVEAVNMCRTEPATRVMVSDGVDRRHVEALATYGRGSGVVVEAVPLEGGRTPARSVDVGVSAVVVQHPNRFGLLEDVSPLAEVAHAAGARLVQVFDPTSLGILSPPGDLAVDIAVAEGQSLGNHLNFGGPYLGLIAARMADVRRMPGRIVGQTLDVEGATGYVLTLQAREQHIRREKATSNICTNQTLMALAAAIHLAWLGPGGLEELGRQCLARATYAFERLCAIPGVGAMFADAPFFKEFALRLPRAAVTVRDELLERGFLAGVPIADEEDGLLVAVTERRTRDEIDGLTEAMAEVLA